MERPLNLISVKAKPLGTSRYVTNVFKKNNPTVTLGHLDMIQRLHRTIKTFSAEVTTNLWQIFPSFSFHYQNNAKWLCGHFRVKAPYFSWIWYDLPCINSFVAGFEVLVDLCTASWGSQLKVVEHSLFLHLMKTFKFSIDQSAAVITTSCLKQ